MWCHQECERPALAMLDLHSSWPLQQQQQQQPTASAGSGAGGTPGGGGAGGKPSVPPVPPHRVVNLHLVDTQLFRNRPGLRFCQVGRESEGVRERMGGAGLQAGEL